MGAGKELVNRSGLPPHPGSPPLQWGRGGQAARWPGNNGQTDGRDAAPPLAGPEGKRGGLAWPRAAPATERAGCSPGTVDLTLRMVDARRSLQTREPSAPPEGRLRSRQALCWPEDGRAGGWWLSGLGLRGEGVAEGPQGLPPRTAPALSWEVCCGCVCVTGVCVRDRCVQAGLRSSSLETEEGACNPRCQTPAPYQPPSFAEPQPPPTWRLPQMCGSSALLPSPPPHTLTGA